MSKVLAIDQAANLSGYSIWENEKPIAWGVISPKPKNLREGARLTSLRKQFKELIQQYNPQVVVIEDPVGGTEDKGGSSANWKTMQILCQVQGMLIQLIHELNKDLDIVSPSSWQYTCGIHARDRVKRKMGSKNFVKKHYDLAEEDGINQDICDSFCIAYHYFNKQEEEGAF